jgi:ribonuclease H / adenosylcobalamin/alpha-ribazole phosphatase
VAAGAGAGSSAGAAAGSAASAASAPAQSASAQSAGGAAGPDLGAPTTFVLLRHGETVLTGEQRFSGSGGSDPALSQQGRAQAASAARALTAGPVVGLPASDSLQAVVSSPLARCQQTAAAVASRLGVDVAVEPGLRETDFGVWDGLTFAEVRERYPAEMAGWLGSPSAAPPGGESFDQVAARVAPARDALLSAHRGRTILLVSHVTPIKTLVRLALGAPPEALFRMHLSPASLTAIAYYGDGNVSVRYVNATAHLG